MYFSWLLLACLGATVHASNVLEVDLVFPRNETYAPTEDFPVVFAVQNTERARFLDIHISYRILNWDDLGGKDATSWSWDPLRLTNWSDHEPYFFYDSTSDRFKTEGHWMLKWTIYWQNCVEEAILERQTSDLTTYNSTTWAILFTTENSAPKVDLVADTANKTCSKELGLAMNVTKTMKIPSNGEKCALVASSTPHPTPDPCRVKIDSAIVESMTATWKARFCKGINPPSYCPKDEESTAQQQIVLGLSCVLAALGAAGFLLA